MRRATLSLAAVALVAAGCGGAAHPSAKGHARDKSSHAHSGLTVTRVGSLPQAMSKAAAVALPGGRLMILGGLVGNTSISTILAGPPSRLRAVGRLPQPTHDAAAALLGGSAYLFGGGQAASWPNVVRVDPATGSATEATPLGEPLSDLGAAVIAGKAYLAGGYTGTEFATAILRYPSMSVVARLPAGTRYAGVTAIGGTIYVAGGLTTSGASRVVYAVMPGGNPRRVATLPAPEDHAGLAALDGTLYYVGARKVLAIDPRTGKVTIAARLPAALSDPSVTTVGRSIVVAGGGTNGVWSLSPG